MSTENKIMLLMHRQVVSRFMWQIDSFTCDFAMGSWLYKGQLNNRNTALKQVCHPLPLNSVTMLHVPLVNLIASFPTQFLAC